MFPNAQMQALAQAAASNPALLGQLTQLLTGHNILAAAASSQQQQQHQQPLHQQPQLPQHHQQQPPQQQPALPQQSLPQNLSKKRGRKPKNLLPESSNNNNSNINISTNNAPTSAPDNSASQRLQLQFRLQQQAQQRQREHQQAQLMQQQIQQMVMQQARQQQQRNQLPTPANPDQQQQQRRKRGRPPLLSSPRHPAPIDLHASTSAGLEGEFKNYLSMYAALNGGLGVSDHVGRPGTWPFAPGTSSQPQTSQPIAGPSSRQRPDDRHVVRGGVDQRQLQLERKHKEREMRLQQERDRQREIRLQQEREQRQREIRLQQERDRQRELRVQQERERERQRKINHKIALAELDRERRRQHMIMIKNLDAYKRNEEREKTVNAMIAERKLQLERRIHQKKLEVELIKEIRKPVDDMILKNQQSLATLNRIPGLKLPGKAFADLLMSFEFLYNFGDTIGFEMKSLPDINTLQIGLLNLDSYAEDQLISVMFHLVWFALKDPRFPYNGSLKEVENLASDNEGVTQLIHFYLQVLTLNAKTEMEHEQRLFKLIEQKYFLQLNATQKAELLAFVCNELLCSQTVIKQMEDTIENITNLRKSKWVLENDLRRWRTIKTKRELKEEAELKAKFLAASNNPPANTNPAEASDQEPKTEPDADNNGSFTENKPEAPDEDNNEPNKSNLLNGTSNIDEQISKADSDNEAETSAPAKAPTTTEVEEEPEISNEELNKKIDKLNRQYNQTSNKLDKALNSMRANPLGQDRYRRRYWVLPQVGGVFVEGMESTEPEELENNIFTDEELIEYEKEQQALRELTNGTSENETEQNNSQNSADPSSKSTTLPVIKRETNNSRRAALEAATTDKDSDNLEDPSEAINGDLDEKMDLDQIEETPLDGSSKDDDHVASKDPNSNEKPSVVKKEPEKEESKGQDELEDGSKQEVAQNETSTEADKDSVARVENENALAVAIESAPAAINIPWFSILPRACCEDYEIKEEEPPEVIEEEDPAKKAEDEEAIADAARSEMTTQELKALRHDICPALAKRLEQLESEQYETPLKIHPQFQRGWWRITDSQQLKSVLSVMHERGSRERVLQKHLAKHFQYACVSCKNTTVDFDITAHDRQLAEKNYGAPLPHTDEDCAEDLNDEMDGEQGDEEEEEEEAEAEEKAVQPSARRSKRKKGSRSARSRRLRAKAAAKKKVENSKKAAVLSQRAQR